MKKSRFSESQIVGVLKEHEAGTPTEIFADGTGLAQRRSMRGKPSLAEWKSATSQMRALEDENRRLKRIVTDQALHINTLKIAASGTF